MKMNTCCENHWKINVFWRKITKTPSANMVSNFSENYPPAPPLDSKRRVADQIKCFWNLRGARGDCVLVKHENKQIHWIFTYHCKNYKNWSNGVHFHTLGGDCHRTLGGCELHGKNNVFIIWSKKQPSAIQVNVCKRCILPFVDYELVARARFVRTFGGSTVVAAARSRRPGQRSTVNYALQ